MEPFHKQESTAKTTSPLLLHAEKQQHSPRVASIQDTNYIGITINDEGPRQTYPNGLLTRHQSLNDYSTIHKQHFNHSRNSSIPFDTTANTPTAAATSNTSTSTIDSPPIYHQHHSPRFNQIVEEEAAAADYMIQPELSGAFFKIKSQADLPMSHHRRAREGKRYGVTFMQTHTMDSLFISLF